MVAREFVKQVPDVKDYSDRLGKQVVAKIFNDEVLEQSFIESLTMVVPSQRGDAVDDARMEEFDKLCGGGKTIEGTCTDCEDDTVDPESIDDTLDISQAVLS